MGDLSPLLLARHVSHMTLDGPGRPPNRQEDAATPSAAADETTQKPVVLSTQSKAALKLGTQQLIPRNLAVRSRHKVRHKTTVVTLPVAELSAREKRASVPVAELSWEDYDSEGDGGFLQRNRRNKSYRAAVRCLNEKAAAVPCGASLLNPLSEEKLPSPQAGRSPRRSKKTIGWKKFQRQGGSFKDEPRLYQQIRERGLNSNNQNADDELLDDSPVEPPKPDQGIIVTNYRPAHVTWSQLPQVKESGVLLMVTQAERKRQEAIFEIITSEYSYLHSLSILVQQFKASPELRASMTLTEHHHLFSNIADIQAASQRFFDDLERRHRENVLIRDISDIVLEHVALNFQPYITYCANETYQQRALQQLLSSNGKFKEELKLIETSLECGGLPMISFLILPMQRVTRLPLLMDTVCQKTPEDTPEYSAAVRALKAISKLVKKCNEGAHTMERTEQMYTIQKQMDFGKIKPFPLVSVSRWLKKRGDLAVRTEELSIFSKAFSSRCYHLFLFNDVLIVTRRRSEESYVVIEYARLQNVEVELESSDGQTSPPVRSSPFSFKLLLKRSSEGRGEQISLAAENQLDRARWVTALQQHKTSDSSIRKEDLPQYEVTKAYLPRETDELGLQQAEVVIVLQVVSDWYHGERMRDGEQGWFPATCATQITNRRALQCNVKRMERLRKETDV